MKKAELLLSAFLILVGLAFVTPVIFAQTCNPPATGNWTITADCSFSGTANGLSSATVANSSILTISGGSVVVPSGESLALGSFKFSGQGTLTFIDKTAKIIPGANVYMTDKDNDGFPASTTQLVSAANPGAPWRPRGALSATDSAHLDCYDDPAVNVNAAQAFPGQTAYFTTDVSGGANQSLFNYACGSFGSTLVYQYQSCSCAVCTANACPFACSTLTATAGHTCGASENEGPSSCTKATDVYGNCTSCTNAGTTFYTVGCH